MKTKAQIWWPIEMPDGRWLVEVSGLVGQGVARHYFDSEEQADNFVLIASKMPGSLAMRKSAQEAANLLRSIFGPEWKEYPDAIQLHALEDPEHYRF